MGIPGQVGAVEEVVRPLAMQVTGQDDGQETLAPRLVVQGLLCLDLQGGMETELVKREFRPWFAIIGGPGGHAGQAFAFFSRAPFLVAEGAGGGAKSAPLGWTWLMR